MYENQFLKFTRTIDPQECGVPLPVVFGGGGINFFVPVYENPKTLFTIVDASGVPFKNGNDEELSGTPRSMEGNFVREMFGIKNSEAHSRGFAIFSAEESRDFVAPNECFRIRYGIPTSEYDAWVASAYPYKGYESAADALAKIGATGTLGTQVITTEEVESASGLPLNPRDSILYYTKDTDKYYVYNSDTRTLNDITDREGGTYLFGSPLQNVMVLKTKTRDDLISGATSAAVIHLLTRVSRIAYAKLHITGNFTRGGSFNNTGGRIIAKYIGMNPYNARQMASNMLYASTHGGFDIEHVTVEDARTLLTSGFEFSIVSRTFEHTFNHEVLYENSVEERYIISADSMSHVDHTIEYNFQYSNLLRRYENHEGLLAMIEYTCGTETFGLPFTTSRPIRQWLPIMVKDPQPEQKDEIYEKLSGERVVMYATINEKYSCETDYIPYEWHKRIVMALSCDIVKINGVRLTKSESYEIDWENKIKLECGEKLTKAEWKMVANITSRNSNN